MPAQPVVIQKLVQGGQVLKKVEPMGGVFAPVVGKGQRPVYTCGPKGDGATVRTPMLMFQCPTSAIPTEVWDLLHVWWGSRQMGLPPVAGGFLDQPVIVQRTFPIFETLMRSVEANRQQGNAQHAAGMAVAAMTRALVGGR